ncbi:MAG: hypothetical protein INR71_16305 [Terriglobus roseus]|nr:hypothetical protein [Terriglobus roseus]
MQVDATFKANSGHPGAPMGMAPVAHILFNKFMTFNPKNPDFPNRDRFVLSYVAPPFFFLSASPSPPLRGQLAAGCAWCAPRQRAPAFCWDHFFPRGTSNFIRGAHSPTG